MVGWQVTPMSSNIRYAFTSSGDFFIESPTRYMLSDLGFMVILVKQIRSSHYHSCKLLRQNEPLLMIVRVRKTLRAFVAAIPRHANFAFSTSGNCIFWCLGQVRFDIES